MPNLSQRQLLTASSISLQSYVNPHIHTHFTLLLHLFVVLTMEESNLITKLPNELLIQIFGMVPGNCGQQIQAFSVLAIVCRHFKFLITPLLYRHVQDCCWKHLRLLGRTVTTNKGLAGLIKTFEERKESTESTSSKQIRLRCSPRGTAPKSDEALLKAARAHLNPSIHNPADLIAFFLYSMCYNVQDLDIRNGVSYLLAHVGAVMDRGEFTTSMQFQRLRSLNIKIVNTQRTFNIDSISLLFNIPSLRALKIKGAVLSREEEQRPNALQEPWRCGRETSTVEELIFEECHLPTLWIVEAVSSCQRLKHFQHEHHYNAGAQDLYPRLLEALRIHRDSLSYIRINEMYGCKVHSKRQNMMPVEPISFADFRLLTHLDIPLFQVSHKGRHYIIQDKFPSSLQVLTVEVRSARDNSSDAFFIALAEAIPLYLPSLKSIEIICRVEEDYETGYLPLHFCHIRRMLAIHGIETLYFVEFVACDFKAGK